MQKFSHISQARPVRLRKASAAAGGFTLIEMLVVIAILALLISLVSPAVGRALERGRATACMMKLREMGTALHLYAVDHRGFKPAPRRDNEYKGLWYYALGGGRDAPYPDGYLPNPRGGSSFWHCPSYPFPGFNMRVHYGMNRAHGFDQPLRMENTTTRLAFNASNPPDRGMPARDSSSTWVFGCGIISSSNLARRNQPPVGEDGFPNPNGGHFYVWHRGGSPFVHLDGSVRIYSLDFLRQSAGAGPTGDTRHDAFWGHAHF